MPGSDLLLWMPWALLCSALAVAGGLRAYRRGDRVGALGWAGWAFVPPALLFTGALRLVGRITGAVLDWSVSLVFTPTTWFGVALGGLAATLLATSRALRTRRGPRAVPGRSTAGGARPGSRPAPAATGVEDDLAEVEEILRRRGIG